MKLKAGVDIDIWCTKCMANSTGTIVAMVGDEIAQVTCKICGSGPKKYRSAKGKAPLGPKAAEERPERTAAAKAAPARTSTPRAARAPAQKKDPTALSIAADLALWQTRRNEVHAEPTPYDIRRAFRAGEPVDHPKWGLGFVEEVRGEDRMQVLFEDGRKLLVMAFKHG